MADTDRSDGNDEAAAKPKSGFGGLAITAVLAAVLGGGGFYATWSGLAGSLFHSDASTTSHESVADTSPTFVELDPLMITVGGASSIRQLRFRAYLQIGAEKGDSVSALQPRILDIFATYLRAVGVDRLEDPTALLLLRAQLLRRVQLLTGPDAVEDLLIVDFVIT